MQSLLRYKDIIFYRILAGMKSEARKNYLGYLWFVLEPLLSTALLYFSMSHITGQRGMDTALSILFGMIAWQWFEGSIMLSASSILSKFHIYQQVPLPKYLFPLVDIGTNTVRFAVAFSLVLIASISIGPGPSLALVWLPLLLMLQLLLIAGLALVISMSVTLLQDIKIVLQSVFRLLFFASGIFFTAERVPAHLLPYFHANPIAALIESYRAVILHQHAPDLGLLGQASLTSLAILALGAFIQNYFDKRLLKLTNA